jgi:hypothetical protein
MRGTTGLGLGLVLRLRGVALALGLAASLGGCSSKSTGSGFNGGGDGGAPPFGGDAAPPLGGDGSGGLGGDGSGPGSGCSDAAKLIYVIDDLGGLHSWDPSVMPPSFTSIGTVNCPGSAGTNSMAVQRNATAWVSDNVGALFQVDTRTAGCQATSFATGQHGFGKYGMGFATDMAGGTSEKLYIDDISGGGLAWIDLSGMKVNFIGMFDKPGLMDCELTGTGDARLFGFFTTTPASVAEIDKTTAHIVMNVPQNGVSTGTDWAFSFWGGDFYLYTATIPSTSDVTRYRPSDGSVTVVASQIGFRIVGAGVSTCAPTQPVK